MKTTLSSSSSSRAQQRIATLNSLCRPSTPCQSSVARSRRVQTCAVGAKPAARSFDQKGSSSGGGSSKRDSSSSSSNRGSSTLRQGRQADGRNHSSSSKRTAKPGQGGAKPSAGRGRSDAAKDTADNSSGSWRLFSLKVPADQDPGKDDISIHAALQAAIAKRLECRTAAVEALVAQGAVKMLRKSFDPRKDVRRGGGKHFVYIVDVACAGLAAAGIKQQWLVPKADWLERLPADDDDGAARRPSVPSSGSAAERIRGAAPVVVVGTGPAGLFAALEMALSGLKVVLLDRGQPVEQRGRDLGAFFVRGVLNPDSNLCYGEGGAGTWSDGKLTTRIGRNSEPVRRVLQAFVQYGAPESILVAGKPHLGTERLVRLLKSFRADLQAHGVDVRFGTTVKDIMVQGGRCTGVVLADGSQLPASAVVLAVGHSARPLYHVLQQHGVSLTAKSFAMGFRIEHPQSLIDTIQYGEKDAAGVMRGKGSIPVADYTLAATVLDSLNTKKAGAGVRGRRGLAAAVAADPGIVEPSAGSSSSSSGDPGAQQDRGSHDGQRGVYSFCMCPGGQIVCTSTNEEELCINGMSFSRRNSVWANSALVVSMRHEDWEHLVPQHGALAGMALQVQYERLGAQMGGGKFVAPVQRVTDFLEGIESHGELPSSSYRLGVRPVPLHELYEAHMTAALRRALGQFDRRLPGFIGPQALLHGVETRTSAPVRIDRRDDSLESMSLEGLYPCGEGAGYAGGIVSAAVDGLRVGEAVVACMLAM